MTACRKDGGRPSWRAGVSVKNENRLVRIALVNSLLRDDGVRAGQVIKHGVVVTAKVTSSETGADNGSLRDLICNTDSRREIFFQALDVGAHGHIAESRKQEVPGVRIPVDDSAGPSGLHRLEIVVAHPVVDAQLRGYLPNVLSIKGQACLPLSRKDREYGAIKLARHPEEERGHAEAGGIDVRTSRHRLAEVKISSRTGIDGEKIEPIPADVRSPSDLVIVPDVGPVVDQLKTRGTVQAWDADAALYPHEPSANRPAYSDARQPSGKPVAQIDTWYTNLIIRLQGRVCLITIEAESHYAQA